MTGASKILTVSYGTFSCTLEGFDDPFNTMKAIAEYFRDLAAEDRYFGAEPPTPDAAMLHRIAEREIQRRVEAKIEDNGIVLRASEAGPVVAPMVAPAQDAPAVVAPAIVPSVAPAATPAAESATESVVEKLSRLRSEVAAQPGSLAPAATVPFVSFAIPDYIEDTGIEDLLPEDLPVIPPAEDALPEAEPPVALVMDDPPLPEETGPDLPESLMAALAGVAEEAPAEVAAPTAPAPAGAPLPQPEMAGTEKDAVTAIMATMAGAQSPEPDMQVDAVVATGSETGTADAPFDGEPGDGVHVRSSPEALIDDDEDAPPAGELPWNGADVDRDRHVEPAAPSDGRVAPQDIAPDLPATGTAQPEVPTTADGPVAAPRRNEAISAIFAPDEDETAAPPTAVNGGVGADLRPSAAEKLQRARARVIRIRHGEDAPAASVPDAAPAVQADAAVPDAAARDVDAVLADVAPTPETGVPAAGRTAAQEVRALLSAEDEAELQRELAALRAAEDEADADAEGGVPPGVGSATAPDARDVLASASADEAMGRLMEQTATEMDGPETRRRQSAIAHLKAAVAATVAERKVTGDKPAEENRVSRLARYRNDLAMVVKSALPDRAGAAPAERPAPLVLVSEQRIDRPRMPAPAAAPTAAPGGVRPRRVASASLAMQASPAELIDDEGEEDVANLFGETKGFAEFVDRVGASTLEELLEASAAYLAGVEGREYFSRTLVMAHVNAVVPPGTFQREDGLRSFGTLMREGRIAKLRRGQFTLSDASAYLAEARKIAG